MLRAPPPLFPPQAGGDFRLRNMSDSGEQLFQPRIDGHGLGAARPKQPEGQPLINRDPADAERIPMCVGVFGRRGHGGSKASVLHQFKRLGRITAMRIGKMTHRLAEPIFKLRLAVANLRCRFGRGEPHQFPMALRMPADGDQRMRRQLP